jgi:ATP/maltotriose-dependent transcriptional regulator MalT
VRQAFPTPLSDEALKQLDKSLQGWVAGLRLLALSLPLPTDRTRPEQMTVRAVEHALVSLDQRTLPSSPYWPLLDYFVTEILKAQPEQLQHFLLQTSVLTRLSGPLCEAVTGVENGAAQLEAIEQAGLFLEALDGTWYRFHTLFAEAMRREATLRLDEEALRTLSLRASHWYEQHAMTSEAIEAALLSHDFEGEPLAHILRQLVPTLQEPALRSYAQTILRAFAQPAEADVPGLASSSDLLVEPLSAQEQRVLRSLAAGRSNREIAHDLVVSVNTVKDHAKHLYRKLGVSNRLQAGEVARQLKLI